MKRVGFLYSQDFLEHCPPAGHPERPDRLRRLIRHLEQTELWLKLTHLRPASASEHDVLAVHSTEHVNLLKNVCASGGGLLDEGDTYVAQKSFDVALLAAGAVITAIDAVVERKIDAAFCAVRPPGHHAERNRPMGFCLVNNVAVGARYAQTRHGVKKVAILDWDVHHGNGTQHIFEGDPTVFYTSLHQYPFYPGTGARSETGIGDGKGFTLNIPLPAGTGEGAYLAAFSREIVPALKQYQPDLLMLSAGFDAHNDDPLGGMKLSHTSFAAMTEIVRDIAPVISVLEGGYNLEALAQSCEAHISALLE